MCDKTVLPDAKQTHADTGFAGARVAQLTKVKPLAVQQAAGGAGRGAHVVAPSIALAEAAPQRARHKHGGQQQQVPQPDQADGRVPQQQEVALRK